MRAEYCKCARLLAETKDFDEGLCKRCRKQRKKETRRFNMRAWREYWRELKESRQSKGNDTLFKPGSWEFESPLGHKEWL